MPAHRSSAPFGRTLAAAALLGLVLCGPADRVAAGTARRSINSKPAPVPTAVDQSRAGAAFGALPLSLEENHGQTAREVRFLAHGAGFNLFLTDREAVVALGGAVVRMRFGAAGRVVGDERLPGTVNYLIGDDPSKWRRAVPTFARVRLERVSPGVDLVVYGTKAVPEYDFVVSPGADPRAVAFEVEGARAIRVDAAGDLVLETSAGEVRHRRPVIYQEGARPGERVPVSGAFAVSGRRVGFRVGAFDRTKPLVVDPELELSTYVGGRKDDEPEDVAVDSSGNVYLTGTTFSRDFPIRNAFQENAGTGDAFVTKMNASGTDLIFSTYLGGTFNDRANGIAVDATGRVFLGGESSSNHSFPLRNEYQDSVFFEASVPLAFLTVLTSAGDDLVYSTFLGAHDFDIATDVAVDIHGNAYIAGFTQSSRFPTKSPSELPPFQSEFGGVRDGFVAKFDPDESGETSLVYSTFLGGRESDSIAGIAVDEFERAYVVGLTFSKDFPAVNAVQGESGGDFDAFVTKLNADGTALFYSTYFGGGGAEFGRDIALDDSQPGDPLPVVTGVTASDDLPLVNAIQETFAGEPNDAFVAKLEADGSQFVFATYFGGARDDTANAVAVDGDGNVYVTGLSDGGLPLLNPLVINGATVETGLFVAELNPAGKLLFSTFVGDAEGRGIATDQGGDVYVVGSTTSDRFVVTSPAFQSVRAGDIDAIVLKIDMVDDDTVATYDSQAHTFGIRNVNLDGPADLAVNFGRSGDVPLSGDWNADKVDTIGVYSPSTATFALRNVNSAGAADIPEFDFGAPNLQPLAGDWDGDGTDTIGVFDPATNSYFLRNSNTSGGADIVFTFGAGGQGAIAIAGDWNGDGVDTVGFYLPSTQTFFLINQNAGGNADLQFVFGPAGATPVAGDWNGDGTDTIGTFSTGPTRQGLFSLSNVNAAGDPDLIVTFGIRTDLPVVGNWDGK